MHSLKLVGFIFTFVFAVNGYAFDVNINVNGYAGYYQINGAGWYSGNQTISLGAGTHNLLYQPDSFSFSVDGSGNVTSLKPASATGSGDTLSFITTTLEVDPQAFVSGYTLMNHFDVTGIHTFTVIANTSHRIITAIGGIVTNFTVDGSGNISDLSHPDNVVVTTGKIVLKNTPLIIDPGKYTGEYQFYFTKYKGIQKVVALSGAIDRIRLKDFGSIADIIVDHNGTVTNINRNNLLLEKGKVTFKTVPLMIYRGRYAGGYTLWGYHNEAWYEDHKFEMVPEATHRISTPNEADYISNFDLNLDGDITSYSGTSIRHERNAIFLRNQNVHVQVPSGFGTNWFFEHIMGSPIDTDSDVFVIPDKEFRLGVCGYGFYNFTITDCASNVDISTGVGLFVLSCISMDRVKLLDLNPDVFVNIDKTFDVQYINRKFSSNLGDFSLTTNGYTISLGSGNFSDYLMGVGNFFVNGRNQVQFSGKDENGSTFNRSYTFWAGKNIVEVDTGSSSTNYDVTINVIQNIGGTDYYFGETKTTQNGKAVFYNVPNLYVWVSTNRNYVERVGRFVDRNIKIQL